MVEGSEEDFVVAAIRDGRPLRNKGKPLSNRELKLFRSPYAKSSLTKAQKRAANSALALAL
jgi:hypothetical protein